MASRWLAFFVWALVGATAVAWLLRIVARPGAVPAHAIAVDTTPSLRSDLSRLMGADAVEVVQAEPAPKADARFKLIGVVAQRSGTARTSIALIAVDGKPPRAYRVGAAVDGDWVLKAVRARGADLGPSAGAVAVELSLAPLAPPATGSLPPAGAAAPGTAVPVSRPVPAPQPPADGSATTGAETVASPPLLAPQAIAPSHTPSGAAKE